MSIQSALVVDDSKVAHIKLRKLLEKRSITVEWVNSGEDAVTALESQTPDVVFMDILMPGMDGFETTKTVLSNPKNSGLSIVMCSGNASQEDRDKADMVGAAGFIGKPYTDDELERVLNEVNARLTTAAPADEPIELAPAEQEPAVEATPEPAVEAAPVAAAASVDIDAIVAQASAAARQAAEETFSRLATDLKQELASMAASSGRDAAMEVAADTAGTVARETSAEVARAAAEEAATAQVQAAMASAPAQPQGLDAHAVTNALRQFADSDEFKRRAAAAAPPPSAPQALDHDEIARVADGTARQVAGEVANQVAAQVSGEASRNAADSARKVAEETARDTAMQTAAGGSAQAEAAVKAAMSGMRMFNIILSVGLFAVIAWLVVDALNLIK